MKYPKQKSKVYVIESPNANELLHKIGESDPMVRILNLFQIDCESYLVINRMTFQMCMEQISEDIIRCDKILGKELTAYIHLSCHGSKDGISLTSDKLSWFDIAEELEKVNGKIGLFGKGDLKYGRLTFCMSACEGLFAKNITQYKFHSSFAVLVGPTEKPTWQQTLTAYSSFYYSMIFNNMKATASIKNMNASIGKENYFEVFRSDNFDKRLDEYKAFKEEEAKKNEKQGAA